MNSKWKKVRLDEVCSLIKRGIGPKYTEEKGVQVINQRCIRDQKVDFGNVRLNDLAKKKIPKDRYLHSFDVLVNSTGVGTLGRVAQIGVVESALTVDSHVTIVRVEDKRIVPKYFGFTLRHKQSLIESLGEGSTGQTELSRHRLGELEIDYPCDIREQKAIAHILGTLDDKIELNRKMNETLEAMAQALFKSWFVDFDPVMDNALAQGHEIPEELTAKAERRKAVVASGKYKPLPATIQALFPAAFVYNEELGKWIPEGWEVGSIGGNFDFMNGNSFRSKELLKDPVDNYHVFKMGNILRGGGFNYFGTKSYYPKQQLGKLNKYLLKKGDILMAMTDMKSSMALLGHTAIMPIDDLFIVNQRVGCLRKKKDNYLNYPYLYFFTNHIDTITEIRSRSNSGVQVNLSTSAIKQTSMIIPDSALHNNFDTQVIALLEAIYLNNDLIRSLTILRDLLLGNLISGKTRLPPSFIQQFESQTEAVSS